MPQITMTRRYGQKIANTLTHAGSDSVNLTAINVALYTDGPTPTPDSVKADFTEAVYPGYDQAGPSSIATVNKPDGSVDLIFEPSAFQCTGTPSAPVTCRGMLYLDGDNPTIMMGGSQFDTPINIVRKYDGFSLPITLNMGSQVEQNTCEVIQ